MAADMQTKFHEDWFGHSCNIKVIYYLDNLRGWSFSMENGDYISDRADKYEGIRKSVITEP
jgi:hypothetical protein